MNLTPFPGRILAAQGMGTLTRFHSTRFDTGCGRGPGNCPGPVLLPDGVCGSSLRQRLDQVEQIVAADIDRADLEPFVQPVRAVAVRIAPGTGTP